MIIPDTKQRLESAFQELEAILVSCVNSAQSVSSCKFIRIAFARALWENRQRSILQQQQSCPMPEACCSDAVSSPVLCGMVQDVFGQLLDLVIGYSSGKSTFALRYFAANSSCCCTHSRSCVG